MTFLWFQLRNILHIIMLYYWLWFERFDNQSWQFWNFLVVRKCYFDWLENCIKLSYFKSLRQTLSDWNKFIRRLIVQIDCLVGNTQLLCSNDNTLFIKIRFRIMLTCIFRVLCNSMDENVILIGSWIFEAYSCSNMAFLTELTYPLFVYANENIWDECQRVDPHSNYQ